MLEWGTVGLSSQVPASAVGARQEEKVRYSRCSNQMRLGTNDEGENADLCDRGELEKVKKIEMAKAFLKWDEDDGGYLQ